MAARPCSIDGCESLTGIPGTARGWCTSHYHRFQRYGDPLGSAPAKPTECIVDDCAGSIVGHGLCSKHYTRWKRHGTTDAPSPWMNLPEGQRWCSRCKAGRPFSEFSDPKRKFCRPCMAAYQRERRRAIPPPVHEVVCVVCAGVFPSDRPHRRYCSAECRLTGARITPAATERVRRRQARIQAASIERVNREAVLERDGWICGLCDEPIDPTLVFPESCRQALTTSSP